MRNSLRNSREIREKSERNSREIRETKYSFRQNIRSEYSFRPKIFVQTNIFVKIFVQVLQRSTPLGPPPPLLEAPGPSFQTPPLTFPGPHFPLPGPPPSRSLPPFSLCFLAAVRLRLYLSFQVPLMKGPLCMVRPGTSYEGWQRAFVDFFLVVQSRSRGAPCQTGVEGLPICF